MFLIFEPGIPRHCCLLGGWGSSVSTTACWEHKGCSGLKCERVLNAVAARELEGLQALP